MITEATTLVYVRVDLASNRVISVSDEVLLSRDGQPVFEVTANSANLSYYIIEKSEAGVVSVRPATPEERTASDATAVAASLVITQRAKRQRAADIKAFYDDIYIRRFAMASKFITTNEVTLAALYSGNDVTMLTIVKPMAISALNGYNEWRYGVCQPVIDAMYADVSGMGIALDDTHRSTTEDLLDTFLTAHGFDIATYHR